jgi:SOS-response transcriptional repressor LexA
VYAHQAQDLQMGRRRRNRQTSGSNPTIAHGRDGQNEREVIVGDRVSLPPPLNGGVIAMAQRTRQRADAAAVTDEGLGIVHVRTVRLERTDVNSVDCVRSPVDNEGMAAKTTGEKLLALKARSKMPLDAIATAAGYRGRSGVQSYFSPSYDISLDTRVAAKLADALEGKGIPPIQKAEIFALTGIPEPNARVLRYEGASDVTMPRDVPIYGTSLGAPRDFDGMAIEQTMLNTGETAGYLPRPPVLNGQTSAYGLNVQGSSMAPRFDDGETIFATDSRKTRPARIGDDVVVYLRDFSEDDGQTAQAVLVKRLVRRTAAYTELEQFSPAHTFKIPADKILRLDRVIPWSELLS